MSDEETSWYEVDSIVSKRIKKGKVKIYNIGTYRYWDLKLGYLTPLW